MYMYTCDTKHISTTTMSKLIIKKSCDKALKLKAVPLSLLGKVGTVARLLTCMLMQITLTDVHSQNSPLASTQF